MLSLQQPAVNFGQPQLPERIGRKVTIAHVITVALVVMCAFAAYFTLERAVQVGRSSAAAIGSIDRQRMLSQRIAGLVAQYALGNTAVVHDLRGAIDAFEQAHWRLVTGNRQAGIVSVMNDPALKRIYFAGDAPLDGAATDFVSRARRVAAMSPQDPTLATQATPIYLAAQGPLLSALADAERVRQVRADGQINELKYSGAAICLFAILAVLAANLAVFRPMVLQIIRLTSEAHDLAMQATTDPLTGMLNKRSFQARGAIEIQKARRYQRPLSLLRIDADQLTAIESAYGPGGGETVLKALTSSFFDGTRVSDLVARVDAEQFAILLPETDCAGAELLAERLRCKINELTVPINDQFVSCTISVGVAAAEKDASFLWPTFRRADQAVYEAKVRGRNRVVVANAA